MKLISYGFNLLSTVFSSLAISYCFAGGTALTADEAQAIVPSGTRVVDFVLIEGPYLEPLRVKIVRRDGSVLWEKIPPKIEADWLKLLSESKAGGQLFFFDSTFDEWNSLQGARGYFLIRDKIIIAGVVTAKS
jgi:hypothetical protein